MSANALQKVIVRMLFDEHFRQQVYTQDESTLDSLSLSTQELTYLTHVDIRRWGIDTKRKDRMLDGILLFAHVSVSLWVESGGAISHLLDFFQTEAFHQAIDERDWVAVAFLRWLATQKVHSLEHKSHYWNYFQVMIPLEIACVPIHNQQAQRIDPFKVTPDLLQQAHIHPQQDFVLSPHVSVIQTVDSLIIHYQNIKQYLRENPSYSDTTAALYGLPHLELPKLTTEHTTHVLLENSTQGILMSEIPIGLARLLQACTNKQPESGFKTMIDILQQAELNDEDICDCLNGLLADQLIQVSKKEIFAICQFMFIVQTN